MTDKVFGRHMALTLLLFTSLLLLGGCAHLSDADIRKNLTGSWLVVQPQLDKADLKITYTISSSGDFTREIFMSHEGVRGVDMSGTWQIQDGYLIETIQYMGLRGNAQLPKVTRWKIIHANGRELVFIPNGMTEIETLRKVSK
jgi:hypothetical protein